MKNPYHKNKGKVHPSPSSSSSNSLTTSTNYKDALSVLNLLPVAILALASTLSVEDREVIAYLVTRSLNTSNTALIIEDKKKCKKSSSNPNSNCSSSNNKSQPIFDCGCFDCYTSYWFRWDSSPNRELIHQAIEAFEEHLTNGEKSSMMTTKNSRGGGGGKKRDKMSRRSSKQEKKAELPPPPAAPETAPPVVSELLAVAVAVPEIEVAPMVVAEYSQDEHHNQKAEVDGQLTQAMTEVVTAGQLVPSSNHKGMARKLLPDVMGLFNSRIWNLWSPNI